MTSPQAVELNTYVENGISFEQYMATLSDLTERVKSGDEEGIVNPQYFPINFQRLKRGIKQTQLSPALLEAINRISSPISWLVITEFWCGDAAQSTALFHHISEASKGKIRLTLVFRDENPELIDAFLTNGAKAIPKVIQLDENQQVLNTWGPRPVPAQKLVKDLLAKGESYNDDLHKWYAQDKGQSLQKEITELLLSAAS